MASCVRQYGESQSLISSMTVSGGGKLIKRTTAEFPATNSKAFDDSKAWSKDIYMLHQEKVVKKEDGLVNEHLPDHDVFTNSKRNKGNDNPGNKVYSKKGRGRRDSMELKPSATFKKLGMGRDNRNNRANQSGVLVPDSQKEKPIEAWKRMWRSLIRREKKDKGDRLKGECSSESLLAGLEDDSTNRKSSPDFDAAEIDDLFETRSLPDLEAQENESVNDTPDRGWILEETYLCQTELLDGLTERNSWLDFKAAELDYSTRNSLPDFDATKTNSLPGFNTIENEAVKAPLEQSDLGDTETERNSLLCFNATELDDSAQSNSLLDFDATANKGATFAELGKYTENNDIISDLLRFIGDKECYKTKSKAWKRGYLLCDSPGTDRSSLIATMANYLQFHICNLHLTGVSCVSDLTKVMVSIENRSVIVIKDFDDWFAMVYRNDKLALAGLLIIIHEILWRCGDERVIVLATNHIDRVNAAQLRHLNTDIYIETSSAQPKALPDGEEIVLFDSPKQKPSVDFDAGSNRAYQSYILVSNSEDTREASRRQCMPEDVLSLAYSMSSSFDCSTSGISSMEFDAPAKSAHLGRAHQSGSILFNSVRKAIGEGLNGGCLSKSLLSLDDPIKRNSLPDIDGTEVDYSTKTNFSQGLYDAEMVDSTEPNPSPDLDAAENKEAMVYTTQERDWNSMELKQPPTSAELGKDLENDGIISDLVGFVRDKDFYHSEGKAWKRAYLLRDSPGSDRSSLIAAMANCLEFDIQDLHPTNVFSISELTNAVASIRSRSVIVIKDFDRWHAMLFPKYRLTLARLLIIMRGLLSTCGDERIIVLTTNHNHIDKGGSALLRPLNLDIYIETSSPQLKAVTYGGEIVLLDSSEQKPLVDVDAANNRAYQSDVLVSNSVEKNMREASRRQCMPEGVLSLVNSPTRISSTDFAAPDESVHPVYWAYQSGPVVLKDIDRWFSMLPNLKNEKWAARKQYSLGKERPFEVGFLSMDEKLDPMLQLIHMPQFTRSSPWALALPDGGEIIRHTALSSSEIAATNSRAQLVGQDQSCHTSSHYERKNTRETPDEQGLEDLEQHFGCKHKHAMKSLAEHQAFGATSNRTHLVMADERGPTLSNSEKGNTREPLKSDCLTTALGLEDQQQHSAARCKDAVKGLCDSLAWKSFEVLDTLPLLKQSNSVIYLARQRTLTHKHKVRLKKSQDLPRSMLRDSSGGLAAQSDIGLPDGGHILSLSEKKIVRKTLKRKCRTMGVLNLEDHQQHVGSRWEDDVKFLGTKRICRQLAMHRKTRAKHIHRQLGTHQWLLKQSAISLTDGHTLSPSEKKTARQTLKRKCRSTSVLSLDNHKQCVDRRWDDAAKSHGTKRICRQRLSIAKHIRMHTGIHLWPFERCAIGLPDGGHILPLSRKKIVRETLKRKGKVKSVLIFVDRRKHVDRRWEDDEKNIGVKPTCRHHVTRRVSIAKRICRQCRIYHRWPFQQGYPLGDERPDEVIHLSTHAKLDSRLEHICISWLGRFSPRPSGLTGGGDIGGPIALSSSEFAAANNIAQHVGQDQSDSAASDSENERTRKRGYPKEINATISRDAILRHYGRRNREDAAARLHISVSTFKRKCREYGIKRWPQIRREKAIWRPPDQHGEKNPPSICKTLSTNGQTEMENDLQDFVEGPTALSLSDYTATENIAQRIGQDQSVSFASDSSENERTREQGDPKEINATITLDAIRRHYGKRNREETAAILHISVAKFKRKCREYGIQRWPHVRKRKADLRPPDQHGEKNPSSTCKTLSTNGQTEMQNEMFGHLEEMNEFLLDFVEGPNDVSSEWAFQPRNQCMVSTSHPNSNGLLVPHPHVSSQILGEDMGSLEDWGNSCASMEEPLLPRHYSGSVSAIPPCSYAAPSQPMPTIPHTLESSEDRRNSSEDVLLEEHVSGSLLASAEDVSLEEHLHTLGSSDDLRNLLTSVEEPFSAGDVSGLINQTVPSCFHPAPSQSMPITLHARPPVPRMMPFRTGRQDTQSAVMLKATYRDTTFKFELPLAAGIRKLKKEVSKRVEVGPGSYHLEYKDVDGTWIIINCDEDVRVYLQLFTSLGNQVIELRVRDKAPNTTEFCQCGRSLKRKRP